MTKNAMQQCMQIISIIGLAVSIILCIIGYQKGLFTSQAAMQSFISGAGTAGIFLFVLFQAVQVVLPILPGGLGCLVGVILFGAWKGFIFNYIGICAGSVLAFLIARSLGRPVLHTLFSEKTIQKYDNWTSEKNRFAKLFALAIFLPVAPDDFLCYLAGTTEMSLSKFTVIILLGKPFAIALYSLGLTLAFDKILAIISGGI